MATLVRCDSCGTKDLDPTRFRTLPHHVLATTRESAPNSTEMALLCTKRSHHLRKPCFESFQSSQAINLERAASKSPKYDDEPSIRLVRFICTCFNQPTKRIFDASVYLDQLDRYKNPNRHIAADNKNRIGKGRVKDGNDVEADVSSAGEAKDQPLAGVNRQSHNESSIKPAGKKRGPKPGWKQALAAKMAGSAKKTESSASNHSSIQRNSTAKRSANLISKPTAKRTARSSRFKRTGDDDSDSDSADRNSSTNMVLNENEDLSQSDEEGDGASSPQQRQTRSKKTASSVVSALTRPALTTSSRSSPMKAMPSGVLSRNLREIRVNTGLPVRGQVRAEEHAKPQTNSASNDSSGSNGNGKQKDMDEGEDETALKSDSSDSNSHSESESDFRPPHKTRVGRRAKAEAQRKIGNLTVKPAPEMMPLLESALEEFQVHYGEWTSMNPKFRAKNDPASFPRDLMPELVRMVALESRLAGHPINASYLCSKAAKIMGFAPWVVRSVVNSSTPLTDKDMAEIDEVILHFQNRSKRIQAKPVVVPSNPAPITVVPTAKPTTAREARKLKEKAASELRATLDRPTRSQLAQHHIATPLIASNDESSASTDAETTSAPAPPINAPSPAVQDTPAPIDHALITDLDNLEETPISSSATEAEVGMEGRERRRGYVRVPDIPLQARGTIRGRGSAVRARGGRGSRGKRGRGRPGKRLSEGSHEEFEALNAHHFPKIARSSEAADSPQSLNPEFYGTAGNSLAPMNGIPGRQTPPTFQLPSSSHNFTHNTSLKAPSASSPNGLTSITPSSNPASVFASPSSLNRIASSTSPTLSRHSTQTIAGATPARGTSSSALTLTSPSSYSISSSQRSQLIAVPVALNSPPNSPFMDILRDARSKVPSGSRVSSLIHSPASTPALSPATSSSSIGPLLGSSIKLGSQNLLSGGRLLSALPLTPLAPIALIYPANAFTTAFSMEMASPHTESSNGYFSPTRR